MAVMPVTDESTTQITTAGSDFKCWLKTECGFLHDSEKQTHRLSTGDLETVYAQLEAESLNSLEMIQILSAEIRSITDAVKFFKEIGIVAGNALKLYKGIKGFISKEQISDQQSIPEIGPLASPQPTYPAASGMYNLGNLIPSELGRGRSTSQTSDSSTDSICSSSTSGGYRSPSSTNSSRRRRRPPPPPPRRPSVAASRTSRTTATTVENANSGRHPPPPVTLPPSHVDGYRSGGSAAGRDKNPNLTGGIAANPTGNQAIRPIPRPPPRSLTSVVSPPSQAQSPRSTTGRASPSLSASRTRRPSSPSLSASKMPRPSSPSLSAPRRPESLSSSSRRPEPLSSSSRRPEPLSASSRIPEPSRRPEPSPPRLSSRQPRPSSPSLSASQIPRPSSPSTSSFQIPRPSSPSFSASRSSRGSSLSLSESRTDIEIPVHQVDVETLDLTKHSVEKHEVSLSGGSHSSNAAQRSQAEESKRFPRPPPPSGRYYPPNSALKRQHSSPMILKGLYTAPTIHPDQNSLQPAPAMPEKVPAMPVRVDGSISSSSQTSSATLVTSGLQTNSTSSPHRSANATPPIPGIPPTPQHTAATTATTATTSAASSAGEDTRKAKISIAMKRKSVIKKVLKFKIPKMRKSSTTSTQNPTQTTRRLSNRLSTTCAGAVIPTDIAGCYNETTAGFVAGDAAE